jgi:uncharacterized damage-inducible protein DinB
MGRDAFAASTPDRELQFLASHTVHHFALVALLLRLAGVSVPDGFGVATATARHREAAATRDA